MLVLKLGLSTNLTRPIGEKSVINVYMYPCLKILLENKNVLAENVPHVVSSCRNTGENGRHVVTGLWLAHGADSGWWYW